MGNTSSERAGVGQGEKAHRRDSRGAKEGDRPKILMDSPEDADIFHGDDIKVLALRSSLIHSEQYVTTMHICRLSADRQTLY